MANFINTVDILGDENLTDAIIERSITEYCDDCVKIIGDHALLNCSKLLKVDFPSVISIASSGLADCTKLKSARFQSVTNIQSYAFQSCSALTTLILGTLSLCSLDATNALRSTAIASGTGYIYVPRALVDSYKTATNWKNYASQFRAIEDWTLDGTVMGELDIENRHLVRFFNEDGTLLGYKVVTTGSDAVWDEPVKEGEWKFIGWSVSNLNVTEDRDCYARFKSTASLTRNIINRSISGYYRNDEVTTLHSYAFSNCINLTSVCLPSVTTMGVGTFYNCASLTKVDLPSATTMDTSTFSGCTNLTTVIIRNANQACTTSHSVCYNTPIASGTGYIYVPAALIDTYKAAYGWKDHAAQFRAIEDYPDICGGDN